MLAVKVAAASAAGALLVGALTGCSGDSGKSDDSTSSTNTATTLENGNTRPGTELSLRDAAVVRYKANAKHTSVIKLVVSKIKKGSIKDLREFNLSEAARKSNVYYISTTVKNVGGGDLSGQPLTLYGKVSESLVVPPVVLRSSYKKCNYQPLPPNFKKNKKVNVCLVMLAPKKGKISEVQWRPADNSEPISWAPH
jgi:hypothetical protein